MLSAAAPPTATSNSGFLSVFQEAGSYIGGYLVTNAWGRPLEFRLTSAVQPTRVQQVLYCDTLPAYVCGELIGKTLIDKTATAAQWVVTDCPVALDLRLRLDIPVALWQPATDQVAGPPGLLVQSNLYCHAEYRDDIAAIRSLLEKLGPIDLGEPFLRVREAMGEARKLGVNARSAA
jgi:hypothetical protein